MKKWLARLLYVFLILMAGVFAYVSVTTVTAGELPPLRDGDMVFQTMRTSQSLPVMLASKSLYSHMGVVKIADGGRPHVVEAVGPVREIPLDQWIAQGVAGRIAVMRIKGLEQETALAALQSIKPLYGRPYDHFFLFGDDALYCSELVYEAYRRGANLSLGKVQKIKSLEIASGSVQALMQERAPFYPPCKAAGATEFEECLPIMLEQELITPQSIADDERLELVYSNYPF